MLVRLSLTEIDKVLRLFLLVEILAALLPIATALLAILAALVEIPVLAAVETEVIPS